MRRIPVWPMTLTSLSFAAYASKGLDDRCRRLPDSSSAVCDPQARLLRQIDTVSAHLLVSTCHGKCSARGPVTLVTHRRLPFADAESGHRHYAAIAICCSETP